VAVFLFILIHGSFRASSSRQLSGHDLQIGRENSPSHPSAEALLSFISAPSQILAALHDAYAPFYAGPTATNKNLGPREIMEA